MQLSDYRSDVIEIAALRGRVREIEGIAATRGLSLPRIRSRRRYRPMADPERAARALAGVAGADRCAGARVAQWHAACAGSGTAVDLSSALTVLHLSGPEARELLARSCRVDLHEAALPSGRAVATVMAQVVVVIAAMPGGLLLLTPSTTARHFREWLIGSARLCGLLAHPRARRSKCSGAASS